MNKKYPTEERRKGYVGAGIRLVVEPTRTVLSGSLDPIPSSSVYYVSLSKSVTFYKPQFPLL